MSLLLSESSNNLFGGLQVSFSSPLYHQSPTPKLILSSAGEIIPKAHAKHVIDVLKNFMSIEV